MLHRLDLAQDQAPGAVGDLHAQRGQPLGRLGPARRLGHEIGVEAGVGKAVGPVLALQPGAQIAAVMDRLQERQAVAVQEMAAPRW